MKPAIRVCLDLRGHGARLLYFFMGLRESRRVARITVKVVAMLVSASLPVAYAESGPPEAEESQPIETIIVTGSRIPRRDFFAISPIVTLDRTELELSGTTEIKTLLNDLPQVDPTVDAGTSNAFGGESFVNLRALGANRTLVLLNGRRYPSQGLSGAVDLNALPPVLIDRVEIITGGASAVYGSDAIAGAVNFILRKDFAGLESNLQYGQTSRGDGDQYSVNLAYGTPFAGDRGNVAVFVDYFQRTEIFQDARGFSQHNLISDDDTGELRVFDSFASAAGSIAGIGPFYTFEPDGTPRLFVEPDDRFSLAPFQPLLAPTERYSANAFGHYDTSGSVRTRFELNYAKSLPTQMVADELFQFIDVNVDRPDIAPEFRDLLVREADPDDDGLATIFLGRTFSPERGPGTVEHESEFWRALVGIEGEWGDDWHWRADASYASNDRETRAINDISVSRVRQGLLVDPATGECMDTSRSCVPVNPFGAGNLSDAAAEFITLPGTGFAESSTETFLTAEARGSPISLPAGGLGLALGAEYRRFRFENTFPNDNLRGDDSLFFPFGVTPTGGTISVSEALAEARVPLLRERGWANYLGLDAGVRASNYNILDEVVWTWKLGFEWQFTEGLRMRAMRQRAIRAPGVSDLFQGPNLALTDLELGPSYDQCSASRDPVGNGLAELCIAQGIPADQIGVFEAGFFPVEVTIASNPEAQPEEADTLSAGFVWQSGIGAGLSASVDYFKIEIDDALATVDQRDLVRLCFLSRDPNDFACRSFTRAPTGDIGTAVSTVINSAVATSEGIDFALSTGWDAPAPVGGSAGFNLSLLATHYLEVGSQGSVFLPFQNCAGKFGAFCGLSSYQGAVPDWRATMRITYASDRFAASLRWRYVGELTNAEAEFRHINNQPPPVLAVPSVSSTSYFDLTFGWDFGENVSLHLGIDNVLDEDPPLLGNAARDANTDPTTYDILGRRYFLRAKLSY